MDMPGEFTSVFVALNENRPISALEEMPAPLVALIEGVRERAVDMPDDLGEIAGRGRQEQMIVVAHEAIDVNGCPIAEDCAFQMAQETFPVPIGPVDVLPFVTPSGDMVEGARIFDSQRACHVGQ